MNNIKSVEGKRGNAFYIAYFFSSKLHLAVNQVKFTKLNITKKVTVNEKVQGLLMIWDKIKITNFTNSG